MGKIGYVDGFVLIIKKDKLAEYRKMAKDAGKIWMKCGALQYVECMGDDLTPDMGGVAMLQFPKMIKAKEDETVWFSFITYKSRKHRDSVNKKMHMEMEKKYKDKKMSDMPFDMKKMAFGGFKVEVGM